MLKVGDRYYPEIIYPEIIYRGFNLIITITKIIHEELGHGKTLFIDMNLGLWLKPYYKQKFFLLLNYPDIIYSSFHLITRK